MARTAEEILTDFLDCEGFTEICDESIAKIVEAMESYHQEKLREELIKYTIEKWFEDKTIVKEVVNDYLNSR